MRDRFEDVDLALQVLKEFGRQLLARNRFNRDRFACFLEEEGYDR